MAELNIKLSKEVQRIVDTIEAEDFSLTWYDENGIVCGAEIETWTEGGVDMIHFIDLRGKGINDADAWMDELEAIIGNFDVDDEIDTHRQDPSYRSAFTYRVAVHDFEEYEERLRGLLEAVRKAHSQSVVS